METCSVNHQNSSGVAGSVPPLPDPAGSTFPPSGDSTRIFKQGNLKAPAFQFYASDFIAGTVQFTAEEAGVYIRFLCYQWMNGGLPSEKNRIRAIAGFTNQPESIAAPLAKFMLGNDGIYRNKRLEEVRAAQDENRRRKSESGKAGAVAKWGDGKRMAMPLQADGTAKVLPLAKDSSPTPTPTPTPSPIPDSNSDVGAKGSRLASICDDDWIAALKANPAYEGVDVAKELGKMNTWCAANYKQPTRRRFVNWLNRCDKPLNNSNANHSTTHKQGNGNAAKPDYSKGF
jgi:uncharacterized protein YdaU (DUF1376 family)